MSTESDLSSLAKSLNNLIAVKVNERTADLANWRHHYNNLADEVHRLHDNALVAAQDYKVDNLTVNAIEIEGYIRALKTIIDFLEPTL